MSTKQKARRGKTARQSKKAVLSSAANAVQTVQPVFQEMPIALSADQVAAKLDDVCETAERLLADGYGEQARQLCAAVLRAAGKHPKALYLAALLQFQAGKQQEALQSLELALTLEPTHETWWRTAAELLSAVGMNEQAENALSRADALGFVQYAGSLGHAEPQQVEAAIQECEAALAANPDDSIALFVLVSALTANPAVVPGHALDAVLDQRLEALGWGAKQPLLRYWLDGVEKRQEVDDPQLSIIIVRTTADDNVHRLLQELKRQASGIAEIILVNNGAPDAKFETCRALSDTYIRLRSNAGAYFARNVGAAFAKGSILLFVDDGLPEDGFVEGHLAAHRRHDVLAVRGAYVSSDGSSGANPHYLGSIPIAALPALEGNCSYNAEAFYAAGGWADWLMYGHGGMELAYRLLESCKEPLKLIYHPAPRLRHNDDRDPDHQLRKQRLEQISWHLISAYQPGWDEALEAWEKQASGRAVVTVSDEDHQAVGASTGDDCPRDRSEPVQAGRQELPSPAITVTVDTRNGHRVDVLIPEREVFRLRNIFEKEEYALPKGVGASSPLTVVDIGANVGAFALYAEGWADRVNIHCFEPNPQVIDLLRKNLAGHGNVRINPFALSDKDAELTLYQNPYNTGATSMTRAAKGGGEVVVPVRRAESALRDAGIDRIDVLKIDTEGSEVAILQGLGSYLERTSIVMLEYHSEKDRRKIDELLQNFVLYSADVAQIGVGTMKYLNARLFA